MYGVMKYEGSKVTLKLSNPIHTNRYCTFENIDDKKDENKSNLFINQINH
jgi:hypothetical protein